MKLVLRFLGTLLFAVALLWVLSGFGVVGQSEVPSNVAESPEASGKMLGVLLPAALFAGLGLWCWQKPRSK